MCLGIPGRVIKIYDIDGNIGNYADVDFGGVIKKINTSMVENLNVNDYVLVHAGFAIEILNQEDAEETLALMLNLKGTDTT